MSRKRKPQPQRQGPKGAGCDPSGGCGSACCNPVVLPFGPADLRDPRVLAGMDARTRKWVGELVPISRREGLRRAPYFSQGGATFGIVDGVPVVAFSCFYECPRFEVETGRCGDYANRPDICSGYPWYGEAPDPAKAIPPRCSYVADVPVQFRNRLHKEPS